VEQLDELTIGGNGNRTFYDNNDHGKTLCGIEHPLYLVPPPTAIAPRFVNPLDHSSLVSAQYQDPEL